MRSYFATAFIVIIGSLVACAPFQDSPYSDQLLRSERDLNNSNMNRLGNIDSDGKIRIAVMADSHQNYKPLDQVIKSINQLQNIDFVAHLGDFSNSGYNIEYNQFLDAYSRIVFPSFMALGNHDAIGAGTTLFEKAFGPANFWFESQDRRFIFFNSCNWEDPNGFNPSWLLQTVEASTKQVIIFTHVSLKDSERFLGSDAQIFSQVINHAKVQMVLNGHNHVYLLGSENNTVLLQAPRVDGQQWLLIEIQGQQVNIQKGLTGETTSVSLKP